MCEIKGPRESLSKAAHHIYRHVKSGVELEITQCLKITGIKEEDNLYEKMIESILKEGTFSIQKFKAYVPVKKIAELEKRLKDNESIASYRANMSTITSEDRE